MVCKSHLFKGLTLVRVLLRSEFYPIHVSFDVEEEDYYPLNKVHTGPWRVMTEIEQTKLTTGEIAKYCGVHYRTVIRWIEQGALKAYQLPGRGDNRVALSDFISFLKQHNIPIPSGLAEKGRLRVLVADDDSASARSIQRILNGAGYDTEIASDGFRAGVMLTTYRPNLLTLDIDMPGASGTDVLDFISKNRDLLPDIKILVVSGIDEEHLSKLTKKGADDFIRKPFDKKVFLEKVRHLFGEKFS